MTTLLEFFSSLTPGLRLPSGKQSSPQATSLQQYVEIQDSVQTGIVAAPGGGAPAGATRLTAAFSRVDTAASDGASVALPPASAGGQLCAVVSNVANTVTIFPAPGDFLVPAGSVSPAQSTSLSSGAVSIYLCFEAGTWKQLSGSGLDALTAEWIAHCTVPPTATEVNALNNFVVTIRNNGILAKLTFIDVMWAPDPAVACLNLLNLDAPGFTQINAPVFTADVGFTMDGNSSLQHASMFYSYMAQNNATALVFAKGPVDAGQDLGAYLGSQTVVGFSAAGVMQAFTNCDTGETIPLASLPALYGFSRSAVTAAMLVANGVTTSETDASTTLGYDVMTVGRYSDRTYGMVILGQALTPTEHMLLFAAVHTYALAVGAI